MDSKLKEPLSISVVLEVMDRNSGMGVRSFIIFTGKKGRIDLGKNKRVMGSIIMK